MLAQFEVVDVCLLPILKDKYEFMLGPVKGSHARVVLLPYAKIFKFSVFGVPRGLDFRQAPPIHKYKVNRTLDRMRTEQLEPLPKKFCEFFTAHLA